MSPKHVQILSYTAAADKRALNNFQPEHSNSLCAVRRKKNQGNGGEKRICYSPGRRWTRCLHSLIQLIPDGRMGAAAFSKPKPSVLYYKLWTEKKELEQTPPPKKNPCSRVTRRAT